MARSTTEFNLTTNLGYTDFQARAADDIRDLLGSVAVMWSDRKDADRRKLITQIEGMGLPAPVAEEAVETYHRSVRLFVDALSAAAHAAKAVGDSHAAMLGPVNVHLRNHGRAPIQGLTL
jgi:hypothetical protein